jgi:hypothetical protein
MINYRKNLLATLLVTIICLSILVSANPVSAKKNTNVYPTDSLQTIQNAITTAAPGAKIIFNAGTYTQGQIIVDNSVTLKGKDATIEYTLNPAILGPQAVIQVLANDVRITGFTIHASVPTATTQAITGIEVGRFSPAVVTSGVQIDNNIIDSPALGVSGNGQTTVTIKNNVISAQNAIWFTNAIDITINNNALTAKQYPTSPPIPLDTRGNPQDKNPLYSVSAIKLWGITTGALVKNNQIDSETYGILVNTPSLTTTFTANIYVVGNQILAGYNGISINSKGSNFVVKDNVVNALWNGIRIEDSMQTKSTVTGNTVTSGATAIMVRNSLNGVIFNNQIEVTGALGGFYGGIAIGVQFDYPTKTFADTYTVVRNNIISGNFQWGIAFGTNHNTATGNTITGGTTSPDYVYWICGTKTSSTDSTIIFVHGNLAKNNIISGVDNLLMCPDSSNPNGADPLLNDLNIVTDVIQP